MTSRFAWDEADPEDVAIFGLLGGVIGVCHGVNDEAGYVVEGFRPTRYELIELARHYLDRAREIEFRWRCYEQVGSETRFRVLAAQRINTIRQLIGEEGLNAALAEIEQKWEAEWAKLEEDERALAPCTRCGEPRSWADACFGPDGACSQCAAAPGG